MEMIQAVNTLWVVIGAVLVIFMQAGFIMLEAGSTRMKNAGHIAAKTIFTLGIGALVFWAVGYGLIFGTSNGWIGFSEFFYPGGDLGVGVGGEAFFLFQMAFAGISLTVAFGGFAERAKFSVYILFAVLFSMFIYPVVAHWIWGGGWLSEHGKQDFAGSTVVHLTGAMAAFAATLMLKPRLGKYNKDGSPNALFGHNQVFTSLGVLILWIGWFGFNAGSTLSVENGFFGYVALMTNLAAGVGAIGALAVSWLSTGKADVPTILNGALAGLVAITASCAFVSPLGSIVIGLIAGILVYYSIKMFEKFNIDDPIFALSVHGLAGVWGTLSTGLFATPELAAANGGQAGLFYGGGFEQLGVQTLGVGASALYAFVGSIVILFILKIFLGGLRVTEEEEMIGLDMAEHGSYGYPEAMKLREQEAFIAPPTNEQVPLENKSVHG
ncbi:ammonium transporter [Bacillaceae bacterium SIJ1]|uniref:ammonium transporter n=1 Tax=Litoribacterium kuwaitense TaxID=1398745 RepID=UPI0013EB3F28|nr:ammonium transporter [Litoribacterium kuwaitense]NGP46613.1 ammonium transporter [Litoribacterium kuwaitense]